MQLAESIHGGRVKASPTQEGFCSLCGESLIPHCGQINIWHWAHQNHTDCDAWYEPETQWHHEWKELVCPETREVVLGRHRADIIGNKGIVIELQQSSIAPAEIREREQYYHRMLWLFDASGFRDNIEFHPKNNYLTFRWKHPRKSLFAVNCLMFWDTGDGIFHVRKLYPEVPCGGWGIMLRHKQFINQFLSDVTQPHLRKSVHDL